MEIKKIVKMAMFNLILAGCTILLLSPGFLNLVADTFSLIAVCLIALGICVGGNYAILFKREKKRTVKVDRLKDIEDYRDALILFHGKNNPFNSELREAAYQLDLFQQKEEALKGLLGAQVKEPGNPFMTVSEEVRDCILSNEKKIINRMMILDLKDQSRFPMHNEFIHHVLGQNRQLLSQYDSLIIEISQIGNSKEMEDLHLDSITSALKDLRNENATLGEYGAAMMQASLDE